MSSARIIHNGGAVVIDDVPDISVLSLLRQYGINIQAPCGGNGTCGKCRVHISEENGQSYEALACRTPARGGMTITVPEENVGIIESNVNELSFPTDGEDGFGLAFDIGTTTVAAALVSLSEGRVLDTRSDWNRQGHRGRDVISRARYALETDDGLSTLSGNILLQMEDMAHDLLSSCGIDKKDIKRIAIAGNTIMEHFVKGLPVEKIVKAPFVPDTLFREDTGFRLPHFSEAETLLMPCISGYVGGDIVCGLCCDEGIREDEAIRIYMDIGTNGEVVLTDGGKITCCSVAMGPAFEGARMSCGMRSVEGAIDHFTYDGGLKWSVIGHAAPKGICGSGIIDLVSILLDRGIIDGTGRLLEPDEIDGTEPLAGGLSLDEDGMALFWVDRENGIFLSSGDIRKVQLAKRAMATGVELLAENAGITRPDIDRLYIAGGFGKSLNVDTCINIGLLPEGMEDRTVYLGNASLRGCCRALCSKSTREKLRRTAADAEYIELTLSGLFSDRYIDNLNFREEI